MESWGAIEPHQNFLVTDLKIFMSFFSCSDEDPNSQKKASIKK